MVQESYEGLVAIQRNPSRIRNICIVAHVDHGKTSLADSLIASNGIISPRLAGRLRYLDSQLEEQERGITMKSSSISLLQTYRQEKYLINLIDSPGHVDFSSEVSAALRLCDGAVIVIDVVEGLCAQTKTVLKQTWQEKLKPILVLNKIDRLITETKLQPLDAYVRMTHLLEQVNAQIAELYSIDIANQEDFYASKPSSSEEHDDSNIYFSPHNGNVVFASALDGWAFIIEDFAQMFSSKLNISEEDLKLGLWGDYYMNAKTKKILNGAQEKAKKPLFVQLALENLWSVYEAVVIRKDREKVEKILHNLQLTLPPRDLKSNDPKQLIQAVLGKWLPLSNCVLNTVCCKLPSPCCMPPSKAEMLLCPSGNFRTLSDSMGSLKKCFLNCDQSENSPNIAFVSKMIRVDRSCLPRPKSRPLTTEEIALKRSQVKEKLIKAAESSNGKENEQCLEKVTDDVEAKREEISQESIFIGFARVFSGCLRKGQELFVLGPKYDPTKRKSDDEIPQKCLEDLKHGEHVTRVVISNLYLMMGRDLELVETAPAGSIVGIGGLEEHVLKFATLSSTLDCPALSGVPQMAVPIVRVAVEPVHPSEMPQLVRGLKLLNQADPCVQVVLQESGEHVLITAGEVHLQKCLRDLKENYSKVEINASPPSVPFRETILSPVDDEANIVKIVAPNKQYELSVRAKALPTAVVSILEGNAELLKRMYKSVAKSLKPGTKNDSEFVPCIFDESEVDRLRNILDDAFESAGWGKISDRILSFGPRHNGPNILMNNSNVKLPTVWKTDDRLDKAFLDLTNNVINGFQLATLAGPLCEEPLMGVCFVIENILYDSGTTSPSEPESETDSAQHQSVAVPGHTISMVKDGCRRAFQLNPQRIKAAMYHCSIQVSGDVVGKLYGILGRRQARILEGDIQEGSTIFSISAVLPVVESFDLANEIRKHTSGLASIQLAFSHWETIDMDPFWNPTTEEELELYGEKGDFINRAQAYMNSVRRRKGLSVSEKLVEFAEKQRTLSKKV